MSTAIVESIDLYPTLAAAAGLPSPPDLDGVDLTPLLQLDGDASVMTGLIDGYEPIAYSEYPRCPRNISTPWDGE